MPQFSEDDVTNFMVTEAVVAKAKHEQVAAQKAEEAKTKHKDSRDWAEKAGLI